MKKLRILHVAKFFPPDTGGMERFVHDLAREQARQGHEVHVLAHAGAHPAGSVSLAAPFSGRLTVTRARVWTTFGGYAPVAPLLPLLLFLRAVAAPRPDIIHVHAPNPAGLSAAFLPRSVPVLLHWHADTVFPPGVRIPNLPLRAWRFLEEKLLRRADRVVITSPEYARTSPFLHRWEEKCRCVPLGLPDSAAPVMESIWPDWRAASFFQSRPEGARILAVGRLAHYKGFAVLLDALAALPNASVCIIGNGEERETLERRIRSLRLEDRVLLAGQVGDAERDACLCLCDVFCLPSVTRAEAFGLSLLEAMQRGKPCVVADVPGSGMTHAVVHDKNGLVCEPGNAPAFAFALGALLDDPGMRQRMGQAGRARFERLFSLAQVCREMDSVYSELVARHA